MTDHADALAEYREAYRVLTERGRILDSLTPDMTPAERLAILRACRDAAPPADTRARHIAAARRLHAAFALEAYGEVAG